MKVAAFTIISLLIVIGLVNPGQAIDSARQSYGDFSTRAGGASAAALIIG